MKIDISKKFEDRCKDGDSDVVTRGILYYNATIGNLLHLGQKKREAKATALKERRMLKHPGLSR